MRRTSFAVVLLALIGALGTPLAAGAEPAPPVEVAENLYRTTLSNGLDVIVVVDRSLPLVTVEICVRNGAFTEPPEYDGLSHLYEHMFFKGNAAIPNQEAYLARQRELGMRWNGTTSTERVNYFFTLASDRWREGMAFMRDAIRDPLFDQTELEKERIVVLDELSRNEANPYFHLGKALDRALWFAYPSYKNVIGSREIIATATREKMLTVQRKFYLPNNAGLFVSGDVDVAAVIAEAEALYGDWEAGADPFVKYPLPVHPPLEADQAVLVEQAVQAVTVIMSWQGPDTDRDVAATYAADVFSFALSRQGSRFQKALVDSGITLDAGISYYTQKNVGPISLSFSVKPEKLQEALAAVAAELARMDADDYLSDDELAVAKTLLEVDDIYGREKTTSWTHTLSFWWALAGLEYYLGYVEHLKQVTRADVQRYVQTYIKGKPRVIAVLLSPEARATLALDEARVLAWSSAAAQAADAP